MTTTSCRASLAPAGLSRAGLRARFTAWRTEQRRRARLAHELSLLDERELTELGISRADFPDIIRGTFGR